MFYLEVIESGQVIQVREYHTAHECTQKLALAHDYYKYKGQAVFIRMLDARRLLIKQLYSLADFDEPYDEEP